MRASRTKTRRLLLQKLYSRIYIIADDALFDDAFFEWRFDFTPDEDYLREMLEIILDKQDALLELIMLYAPKFDVDTMLKTNILALMIAISEMLYLSEEIPAKVSMDEAINLAKYFWDDTSKNIVNGVLHSFYKNIEKHIDTQADILIKSHHFFS